jgi:hypothetical protein
MTEAMNLRRRVRVTGSGHPFKIVGSQETVAPLPERCKRRRVEEIIQGGDDERSRTIQHDAFAAAKDGVVRKVFRRLMWFLFPLLVVSFVDRSMSASQRCALSPRSSDHLHDPL